jgi:hypothetical protein
MLRSYIGNLLVRLGNKLLTQTQTFSASGTWVKPKTFALDTSCVEVRIIGRGGGGGFTKQEKRVKPKKGKSGKGKK